MTTESGLADLFTRNSGEPTSAGTERKTTCLEGRSIVLRMLSSKLSWRELAGACKSNGEHSGGCDIQQFERAARRWVGR